MQSKKQIYIFCGNHDFARFKARKKLIQSLLREGVELIGFEVSPRSNQEVQERIRQSLTSSSFFNTPKIITIRIVKEGRASLKSLEESLLESTASLSPDVTVIIDYPGKPLKTSPLFKKLEKDPGVKTEKWEIGEKMRKPAVIKMAGQLMQQEKISIGREVIEMMAGASQGNFWYVESAVRQAAVYLRSQNKSSDDKAIEELWNEEQEKNIFHLLDSLGGGEKIKVMNMLYQIMQEQSIRYSQETEAALSLTSMMGRQIRQLIAIKGNISSKEAFSQWQIPYFAYYKLKNQAANFSISFLKEALWKLAEVQKQIKSGLYSPLSIVNFFTLFFMSHYRRS